MLRKCLNGLVIATVISISTLANDETPTNKSGKGIQHLPQKGNAVDKEIFENVNKMFSVDPIRFYFLSEESKESLIGATEGLIQEYSNNQDEISIWAVQYIKSQRGIFEFVWSSQNLDFDTETEFEFPAEETTYTSL
jgi:hypothetical protein